MGYALRAELHLDSFEKSRKATVGFAMSVALAYFVEGQLHPPGRIFVKSLNLGVLLKSVEKIEV